MATPIYNFELLQQDDIIPIVPNNEAMSLDVFFIKFCIWIKTLNSDEEISVYHLIQEETFVIEREHILCDLETAMPNIYLWILHMRIPSEFQLDIAIKIYCFVFSIVNEPHNIGRRILPMIMHFTTLRSHPNAQDDTIARLLTMPLEDPMQNATPATKTSIEALKEFRLKDLDLSTKCVICLQKFSIGAEVKRMSCSHIYHGDCIVQWLKKSHLCPLCRFEMHTASS